MAAAITPSASTLEGQLWEVALQMQLAELAIPSATRPNNIQVNKKGRRQEAEGRRYKTIQFGLEPQLIEDHQPPVWWGLVPDLGKAGQRTEG